MYWHGFMSVVLHDAVGPPGLCSGCMFGASTDWHGFLELGNAWGAGACIAHMHVMQLHGFMSVVLHDAVGPPGLWSGCRFGASTDWHRFHMHGFA